MSKATTIRLPKESFKELEELTRTLQKDRADVIREALRLGIGEMKLRLALELYSKGKISYGKMAELTGMGYRELSIELKRRNIPLRYGEERFSKEITELVS